MAYDPTGRQVSLWRVAARGRDGSGTVKAVCDLGCEHVASVVEERVLVTVAEVGGQSVGGLTGRVRADAGWRAEDTTGRSYYSDWTSHAEDFSASGHRYWQTRVADGVVASFTDAVRDSAGSQGPFVLADGTPVGPLGAVRCPHGRWSLPSVGTLGVCAPCSREQFLREQGQKVPARTGPDTSWMR